jgi:hypothetical protein
MGLMLRTQIKAFLKKGNDISTTQLLIFKILIVNIKTQDPDSTWSITDVNRIGLGGNTNNLPFKQGTFSFNEDGSMIYTNISGAVYKGSWDIKKNG